MLRHTSQKFHHTHPPKKTRATSRRMQLPSLVMTMPPMGSRSIFSIERGPRVVPVQEGSNQDTAPQTWRGVARECYNNKRTDDVRHGFCGLDVAQLRSPSGLALGIGILVGGGAPRMGFEGNGYRYRGGLLAMGRRASRQALRPQVDNTSANTGAREGTRTRTITGACILEAW